MVIRMAIKMAYLTTLLLPWKLALPTHGNDKSANSKAIVAIEWAAEFLICLSGSRALIMYPHLSLGDKYFIGQHNHRGWVVAAILARKVKR